MAQYLQPLAFDSVSLYGTESTAACDGLHQVHPASFTHYVMFKSTDKIAIGLPLGQTYYTCTEWFLIASLEEVFIIKNPESGHERPVDFVQYDVE